MSRVIASIFSCVTLGAISLSACSSDRTVFTNDDQTPIVPDGGIADASQGCGYRCSRDLKKVLSTCVSDEGSVIAECPPGQGCGVDKCVDACTSAELSKGSTGCSFWMLPADEPRIDQGAGGCFAAMVSNTWDVPVNLTAEYGSAPLDISKSIYTVARLDPSSAPVYTPLTTALAPGQVAIVFLSQAEKPGAVEYQCPAGIKPALMADPILHGTTKTKAFHLVADAPIAAYSVFPYGGAPSAFPTATLLLPVSTWDTSYIAVTAASFGNAFPTAANRRTLQIVANEDDTKVTMRPNVDIAAGHDVAPALTGDVVEWSLAKGEVLQVTQLSSVSGSGIVTNKPVGMFGGSPCTLIPSGWYYCDDTQQQIAPFSQWGSSYALVPYLSRLEGVTGAVSESVQWSFVGAVDGTQLSYDPVRPPGAPETLSAGQVFTFETDAIVTVSSQDAKHPFHASVYMTSATYSGGRPGRGETLGDSDFVNVAPSDQFLDRYVFFADYTYPETSLTLVRRKTNTGFKPVTLACGGEISGWQPLGKSGEYEYTWVRLTSGFAPQKVGGGECGYGRHEATSEGPFGLYVWGLGAYASYGYVGGIGARPINAAPPLVVK
ncbi:hypothetical protein AKJ09_07766 [Labilithrix luteola]|uniref:IgGFc-binding protein N-terminal domain-containing protein n=1 Tax=Labilithrix luteola TaxID=1391654 RepID=A0A0K1Q5T9_9BACT|nr:IgGFc-binding protein [Labilithrix luteola]AKV01103.1 hypothetical protein AKJ09_07766 [Labilithrix luteola]